MARPRVRIVVFTEDTSKKASTTWEHFVKRLASVAVDACDTSRVDVEQPVDGARAGMGAQRWRNRPSDPATIGMLREIASLLRREATFVFFHVDGDRVWSQRSTSPIIDDYEKQVVARVGTVLRETIGGRPGPRRRRPTVPTVPVPDLEDAVAAAVERLRLLCPFYSIESWLLQATEWNRELCTQQHRGEHTPKIDAWANDRALLDEEHKPGELPCLKKAYNSDLAQALTRTRVAEVVALGRSLGVTVCHLRESAPLIEALRATSDWTDTSAPG